MDEQACAYAFLLSKSRPCDRLIIERENERKKDYVFLKKLWDNVPGLLTFYAKRDFVFRQAPYEPPDGECTDDYPQIMDDTTVFRYEYECADARREFKTDRERRTAEGERVAEAMNCENPFVNMAANIGTHSCHIVYLNQYSMYASYLLTGMSALELYDANREIRLADFKRWIDEHMPEVDYDSDSAEPEAYEFEYDNDPPYR